MFSRSRLAQPPLAPNTSWPAVERTPDHGLVCSLYSHAFSPVFGLSARIAPKPDLPQDLWQVRFRDSVGLERTAPFLSPHATSCGREAAFRQHVPLFVQDAVATRPISQIDSYRQLPGRFTLSLGYPISLHSRSPSLHPRVRFHGSLSHPAGDRPSHHLKNAVQTASPS